MLTKPFLKTLCWHTLYLEEYYFVRHSEECELEEKMGKTIASALGMQGWDKHNLYMFDFYFYLPDEVKAESLASELRAMGYKVEVQPSASDSTILCLGTKLLVPQEKAMDEL